MIFKTLSLNNIRSYKNNESIAFPIGTSLFEGDIGSGKSTLLMAIEFALFGLGNQKGDSLLRKGSKKGSVTLEFGVGEDNYLVQRSLIRKENDGPVRQEKGILGINGAKLELSPSEIKEKILKILNFKEPLNPRAQSVIFRYAVYTPQEEMKYILSQKPDERLQTLRKAFGIEDYKIAAENANILSRSIKDKLIELKTETKDLDDKKQELFVLKGNLDANKTKNAKSQARGEELDILQKTQKETLEKLQESELELKKIQVEIPHLKKQIEEKEKLSIKYQDEIKTCGEENKLKFIPQIETLEKIEKPTNETEEDLNSKLTAIKKIIKEHDSLKSNLALLNDSKQSTENELGENKTKTSEELLKEKDALILKIKEKYDAFKLDKEQVQKISEDIYKLDVEKSETLKKLNNVDGLGELCPICGSVLNEEHKKNLKAESDEKIKKMNSRSKILSHVELKGKKQLESEEIEIKTLENNLNDLKLVIDKVLRLDDLKNKINSIYMKLNSFDNDLKSIIDSPVEFDETDRYITHFETLLDKLKEYNQSQKDLENAKYQFKKNFDKIKENNDNIDVLTAEINSLRQNLAAFQGKLEELKNIPNEIAEVKFNYQKTEEEFQAVKEKIVETKTIVEKLQEDISKVKDEINKKESLKKQLDKFNDYHIWLNDYLIPTLSLIEKHVMQKRYEEFNGDFQKWFSILIEDISKTAKIDEEFTPIVEQDGFEQDINYLSGGEKTSVALAYRLALNNIVQKVSTGMKSNLLILDEPTDGFSREQLYKVREILNELDCPQVIIVSHERELGSFADNVFKVEKIDGNSCVTLSG
ncbi:AAA family ATPase [Methanobacterium sp. MBAC-LM]|uniref:AAA family ATPase n=1 Tax=Methanobacterium sp. MBAC-LM TaxID=3412034 RepID=UPI003C741945